MLRSTLLYLSHNAGVRNWVETSPVARRLSARFVAGSRLDDALRACRKIQSDGITATLDYLGENVHSLEEASACRDMYLRMLAGLASSGFEPNVSLKLTQFGLDFSTDACQENVAVLAEAASKIGGFVRIDMESSEYTDRTLTIVRNLHARYGCVGTVIQSYLMRSEADIAGLVAEGIRVRLCKGAYLEPATMAYPSKQNVDLNYVKLAGYLLSGGKYPAIATHDEQMIDCVERFVRKEGIPRRSFEFQMLYGIRRDLQKRLVEDGYKLRLYVPFGEAWYPYFMRRLAERPANVLFLARNLMK